MPQFESSATEQNVARNSAGTGIKKETVFLVGLICIGIGFLLGLAFSSWRSPMVVGEGHNHPEEQTPMTGGKLSPEQSKQMVELELEVQKNPENVDAWTSLGHLYFDSDQFEKAINAYTRSLALFPNNPDVLTDLGVMYRNIGDPDKAIESFDRAIAVNAKHETARFNKGVVLLYDKKDQAGALQAWRELVVLNPMATAPNGQLVTEIIQEMSNTK